MENEYDFYFNAQEAVNSDFLMVIKYSENEKKKNTT